MLDLAIGACTIFAHGSTVRHQPSLTAVVILAPIFLPPLSAHGTITVLCEDDLSRGSLELSTHAGSSSSHRTRHMQSSLTHIGNAQTKFCSITSKTNVIIQSVFAAIVSVTTPLPAAAAVASLQTECGENSIRNLNDKALCPAVLDASFHLGAISTTADDHSATLMVPSSIEAFCLSTKTTQQHSTASQSYAVAAPMLQPGGGRHNSMELNANPSMVKVTNHALLSGERCWGTAGLLAKPFLTRASSTQPAAISAQDAAADMLYEVKWQASEVYGECSVDAAHDNVGVRLHSYRNASHLLATGIQLAAHASRTGLASVAFKSSQQSGISHVSIEHAHQDTNQTLLASLLKTLHQEAGSTICSVMSISSNASSTAGSSNILQMSTAVNLHQPSDDQGSCVIDAVSYLPLLARRSQLSHSGSNMTAVSLQARATVVITGRISTGSRFLE